MSVIANMMSPDANRAGRVNSPCVDVRTGYMYETAEKTATKAQRSDLWGTADAIDGARREAEREAFSSLLDEIRSVWGGIAAAQR